MAGVVASAEVEKGQRTASVPMWARGTGWEKFPGMYQGENWSQKQRHCDPAPVRGHLCGLRPHKRVSHGATGLQCVAGIHLGAGL